MRYFDLLLTGNRTVTVRGETWEQAARDYVTEHQGASVVAWRDHPKPHGLSVLGRGVVTP